MSRERSASCRGNFTEVAKANYIMSLTNEGKRSGSLSGGSTAKLPPVRKVGLSQGPTNMIERNKKAVKVADVRIKVGDSAASSSTKDQKLNNFSYTDYFIQDEEEIKTALSQEHTRRVRYFYSILFYSIL